METKAKGFFVAVRTEADIAKGRSASFHGTQMGAAWPSIEAAEKAVPHYAKEWTVVDMETLRPRRGCRFVVCPEANVEAEIANLQKLGHVATPKC